MGNKHSKTFSTPDEVFCYAFVQVINDPNVKEAISCTCFGEHALNSLQGQFSRMDVLKKCIKVGVEAGFSHEELLVKLFGHSDPYVRLFTDTVYRSAVKRFFSEKK